MIEGVFATGEATWSEDLLLVLQRRLPREEGYFTFSYSPIRDGAGAVGGIFCACTETTDRVVGERRLRTLRDLGRTVMEAKAAEQACAVAARTLAANPADIPFALVYLPDGEARHARLVAACGLEAGGEAAPDRIDLGKPAGRSAWPLRRVFETEAAETVADLATRVRGAVETSKPLIKAARHWLAINLPAEPLTLDADPARLAQVLANLLNNAAKYTDPGGQIWLTARQEEADVVMSVRDNGAGIPADMQRKVFDLFTQVGRTYSRAQGGLGIGLTLVRSMVERHGGRVEVRSDGPGRGSEFIVRLPLAAEQLDPQDGGQQAVPPAAVGPRRILVVDDNRDSAGTLGLLLWYLGTDVIVANDGPAALEMLQTYRPAVVILDIGLPGMDGYEVARRIRQQPEGRDVTLIALTGWR